MKICNLTVFQLGFCICKQWKPTQNLSKITNFAKKKKKGGGRIYYKNLVLIEKWLKNQVMVGTGNRLFWELR
jgi:hypothetical protein